MWRGHRKNYRSKTLFSGAVEVLIVVSMILTAILVCGGSEANLFVGPSKRAYTAQVNAKAWGKQLGLDVASANCSGFDSDNDGYVSCTLLLSDEKLRPVECGYYRAIAPLGQNTGCKIANPLTLQ
jgi:hypothetical protein